MGVGRVAAPRAVEVTVAWVGEAPITRTFWLASYERLEQTLDNWQPRPLGPLVTGNALIEVRCDGACWAETAIYYQPLARGVPSSRSGIDMRCEPAASVEPAP